VKEGEKLEWNHQGKEGVLLRKQKKFLSVASEFQEEGGTPLLPTKVGNGTLGAGQKATCTSGWEKVARAGALYLGPPTETTQLTGGMHRTTTRDGRGDKHTPIRGLTGVLGASVEGEGNHPFPRCGKKKTEGQRDRAKVGEICQTTRFKN